MPWMDMASDAGYRGDEQRQVAAMIEQQERDRFEARAEDARREDEQIAEAQAASVDVPF